jgi:hypothetical protein
VLKCPKAIRCVSMELQSNISETVSTSVIRFDVMSDLILLLSLPSVHVGSLADKDMGL